EVNSTADGGVILRVVVERNASLFVAGTPKIYGLEPLSRYVDGNRTVALFRADRAGTYLLEVRGATANDRGAYRLRLDVAGDANTDGVINGADSVILAAAFGTLGTDKLYNFAADLDANGAVNQSDRLLLIANYGFADGGAPAVFPNYFGIGPAPVHDWPT